MKQIFTLMITVGLAALLMSPPASAKSNYEETTVADGGALAGVVSFKGKVPQPIMEDLNKGKNSEFCITHPDTVDGHIRPRIKMHAKDGKLQDAVVFIENIEQGKSWGDQSTQFDFKTCDIFPKITVVRTPEKGEKDGVVQIINRDPDILHNPHGYSVSGANRKTLFNKPLPSQGDVADVTKNLKRLKPGKDDHFFLQCDQHNFMEADARVVWNPYYALTGPDGAFKITDIPPGKYKVTAWHPYGGETTKEVTITARGEAKQDFEIVSK
ncbi:MAG: hypothetical protein COV67_02825 [Nitrospinae bacterium CG11_big_fil_rev_8_21_14_0_20_56_8]|nr:MAG: hypothetical protein COV67_02825 [Nitrospinae bacterium CG11_big_fil_rev_8_21_14_0_20_56_8]